MPDVFLKDAGVITIQDLVSQVYSNTGAGQITLVVVPAAPAASAAGCDQALDRSLKRIVWAAMDGDLIPYSLNPAGILAGGAARTIPGGTDSSNVVVPLPGGKIVLAYKDGTTIKAIFYNPAVDSGLGTPDMISFGTGTLADICLDKRGRLIAAVYNAGWKCSVALLGSDGKYDDGSAQKTLNAPNAIAGRGSIIQLPGGKFAFAYPNNSGSISVVFCDHIQDDGTGTWA